MSMGGENHCDQVDIIGDAVIWIVGDALIKEGVGED